jgi:hypothetical protein
MAVVQVRKSDLSGEEIPEGHAVRVRLVYEDADIDDKRADLSIEEAERLLPFAETVETRPQRRGEKRVRLWMILSRPFASRSNGLSSSRRCPRSKFGRLRMRAIRSGGLQRWLVSATPRF